MQSWHPPGALGARLEGGACTFRVWAPATSRAEVILPDRKTAIAMDPEPRGYFRAVVDDIAEGARYQYALDGAAPLPDPASRWQPDGVHGPSAVVDTAFAWTDKAWRPPAMRDVIFYELHVGTFTKAGTFDGVAAELPRLRALGVNMIELLPVAQFPGTRNWGYDGVYPFAVQDSYGGARGLKRLIDAAHAAGIGVALDVVYNHLGPEGNYLAAFGPYFADRYRTPWGAALNFDGPMSDEVRAFFIQSALQWADEFHVDALRFDAIHAIVDASAYPFLAELTDSLRERAAATGRTTHLIAESDLSDPRVITSTAQGGLGFDAQWLDDFHHAVHVAVTGETRGYYADYAGLGPIAKTLQQAYVYAGDYSPHRARRHGAPLAIVRPDQFVVFAQNHDQVGNRLAGDRFSTIVSFSTLKLIAACVLLGPYTPLLFMGEEYGETSPFPFFVSHGDEALIEAVRNGRKAEFASFEWKTEPPDPQSEATFASAVLDPSVAEAGASRALLRLHTDLVSVRRATPAINAFDSTSVAAREADGVVAVDRAATGNDTLLLLNFSGHDVRYELDGEWQVVISTDDPRYAADDNDAPADAITRNAGRVSGTITLAAHTAILMDRETA